MGFGLVFDHGVGFGLVLDHFPFSTKDAMQDVLVAPPRKGPWTVEDLTKRLDNVPECKDTFLDAGLCIAEKCLTPRQVNICLEQVVKTFTTNMKVITQLDLFDDLEVGFTTFKTRQKGRYDMVIEEFQTDEYSFLHKDAPWLKVIKSLLGDDCQATHMGCMFSRPGSEKQMYHQDGPHLNEGGRHLPPHALNVFIPLVNVTRALGPTEFIPTTHFQENWDEKIPSVAPTLNVGQVLLFDYRIRHCGLGNKGVADRPVIYISYGKKGWTDRENFSSSRYKVLPKIQLDTRSRSQRAADRDKKKQHE